MNNEIEHIDERSTSAKVTTLNAVKNFLKDDAVKKRFEEILGKKSAGFVASITSLVSSSTNFDGTEPKSIIASAIVAATLDLPINPQFGFAYIIPYNDSQRQRKLAQFQIGYKGFVQLAMRTSYYKTMNAAEVYEGEIKNFNRITGEIEFDTKFVPKPETKIIGYVAYFRLLNGFEKYLYMSYEDILEHAKRYSKTYNKREDRFKGGKWSDDFDAMAKKTVLKLLLSKYGILSVELQTALQSDQSTITENAEGLKFDYVDNPETEDAEVVNEELSGERALPPKPEVESVETEPKSKINLSPEDWESPIKVIAKVESISDPKELAEFKKTNKNKLQSFSGKDHEAIQGALVTQEHKLKNGF
ncbi:MAG: recombinase RecT [Melioribacter sp.]|nr:recombinase RecT [Melioribacter sp.]